ncbi:MAG TPA: heme exporter protein CcmB [Acidimicrobiales bacterium]|nr:heme exporter protein CcmB [Acidimicrobiales bacterium]
MWRDALAVAGKDLRIERRSRVAMQQIVPFAVLVVMLFAFALDANRTVLTRTSAGLFWVAVLFSALLAVQRSQTVEGADGVRDATLLSGLDPAGVFLGKSLAVVVQLLLLEVVLALGVVVLYDVDVDGLPTLVATMLVATVGLAAAGSLYGALAGGLRVSETLLPLLLLPVVAPVLIAATRASESALDITTVDVAAADWLGLLGVFAAVYVAFGLVAYGALMED